MKKVGKLVGLAGLLAFAVPSVAHADGFQSWHICGGSSFTTCASVQVTVVGSDVTVQVWNLSGNTAANFGHTSNAGSIFTGIGFYNVPAAVNAVNGSLTMNGPTRPGQNPGSWTLTNNGRVDFIVDVATNGGTNGQNGISSGCASAAQLPGAGTKLFQNPCSSPTSGGFVTFKFKLTPGSVWDPSTSQLVLRGKDVVNNQVTECRTGVYLPNPSIGANCFTVTPEPVSMTLLATGLASMGGVGFFRRRKNSPTV
ncbi:MAG: hypothetical protein ABJD11_11635 [Gemmatimonadota bacterium]